MNTIGQYRFSNKEVCNNKDIKASGKERDKKNQLNKALKTRNER